jgi:hypothetical protein
MHCVNVSFVAVVHMAVALGAAPTADQAAGSVLPIFADYDAPPVQLDQLTTVADAVAVFRIEGIRFESSDDAKVGRARDVTRYDVRLVETLKPYAMLPATEGTLTITRLGGQHTENGKTVRSAVRGFEDFQQNGEYVLFLTWNTRTNDFDIAYGPNGSYQLLPSGVVRPLGRSEVATKQEGKGKGSFLQELRIASARECSVGSCQIAHRCATRRTSVAARLRGIAT